MKIFSKDGKINFVDDNNVFVGYSDYQNCCESFGWVINDKIPDSSINLFGNLEVPEETDLKGYNFDKTFYKNLEGLSLDEGGAVCFRLVKGKKEKYLILYNSHNGYYGHGFEFESPDGKITNGCL